MHARRDRRFDRGARAKRAALDDTLLGHQGFVLAADALARLLRWVGVEAE
jgi:hypothetical protein